MSSPEETEFQPIVLARILKSKRTEIRVQVREWAGAVDLDIRLWAQPKGIKEYRPTIRGVAVPLDRVPEFLAALKAHFP